MSSRTTGLDLNRWPSLPSGKPQDYRHNSRHLPTFLLFRQENHATNSPLLGLGFAYGREGRASGSLGCLRMVDRRSSDHRGEFKPMERVLAAETPSAFSSAIGFPPASTLYRTPRRRRHAAARTEPVFGDWGSHGNGARHASRCHRPIANVPHLHRLRRADVQAFDPDTDPVFVARRGFYRDPVARALEQSEPNFLSLIAAEHTAQLNAAQPEDVFSEAEKHEVALSRYRSGVARYRSTRARYRRSIKHDDNGSRY